MNHAITYQNFPSPSQVWEWQTTMQNFGPRLTGIAGHRASPTISPMSL